MLSSEALKVRKNVVISTNPNEYSSAAQAATRHHCWLYLYAAISPVKHSLDGRLCMVLIV